MKLSPLFCALLLSLPGWCACANPAASLSSANLPTASLSVVSHPTVSSTGTATDLPPAQNLFPGKGHLSNGPGNPLRERRLYYKGKGTMGLVLGLTLGPVGYGAVHLFSHNLTMRDKAKSGMAAWIGIVIVGGLVWWGISSKVSLDDVLEVTLEILAQAI